MKTDKKRSFKGAVLFTVVSVMSLLIVFLTSTLVLATAANNRAHKSYSSSQANYTARAAIDSILKAASEDESFATAMAGLTAGNGFDVDVTMENSIAGIGRVDKARVEYAGKKQFYDTTKQEWVEKDLLSITADVTSGGETKTITAYALKNPPQRGGGGGGGGGFVTVGGAGASNHTISFGGTYLGIGMSKGSRYYQGDYSLPTGQIISLEDKLYLNRIDNQPGVFELDDMGNPTGNYLPNLPETTDANNIVTYSFGNEGSVEAPFVANGNLYANTKTEIYFPAKGTGMSVWGNMTFQNPDRFSIKGNPNIKPGKFNEIPYIYVDSLFQATSTQLKFNTDGAFPLNMFCGSVDLKNANIGADIYCQDSRKTSTLSGDANTSLYKWSDSVINSSAYLNDTMSGNFYSKGSVIVKDTNNWVTINGDMVVEGDLTITGKLKVTGSLVVGGVLTVEGDIDIGAGHSICADMATGSKIQANMTKKMTADGSQELYEEKQRPAGYCVLAKNVKVQEDQYNTQSYPYAWLKPEAITAFGLTDTDGDGIIDGNFHDFGGAEVDKSLVVERLYNMSDETSETKAYMETYWENREDGTTTTNELDTFDSSGFKYNGSVNIAGTDFYKNTHNGELFPRKAEKAVILGLEEIGDGTPTADSKVLKTVEEIEADYNFENKSITAIPSDGGYLADVNANVYTNSDLPAEITTSCTLSGSGTFTHDIIIKNTSTNDIWVKLEDGFMMDNGGDIIYDDSYPGCGNLNLFVDGSANLRSGRSIYTKSYKDLIDSHTQFQIASYNECYVDESIGGTKVECPKINIYSKKTEYRPDGTVVQPSFEMSAGNSIVTAAIEAPNMKFDITNAKGLSGNNIYYNGRPISDAPGYNGDVGVIGILNVAEGSMQNNWSFLYTPRDVQPYCTCMGCSCGGGTCSTCGLPCTSHCTCVSGGVGDNSYVITYYEGF